LSLPSQHGASDHLREVVFLARPTPVPGLLLYVPALRAQAGARQLGAVQCLRRFTLPRCLLPGDRVKAATQ